MTPQEFLDEFGTLAESAEGVPKLRELILELAVRGKLVEQDQSDEPASDLYQRMLSEASESNGSGKRKPKASPDVTAEDAPFPIPSSWYWLRFGQFLDIQGGGQPPKSKFVYTPEDGYIRLFQIRDFGPKPEPVFVPRDTVTRLCTTDDVMLARYGASVGKVFLGQDGAYNVALTKILFSHEHFAQRFIHLLLKAPVFQVHLEDSSRSAQAGFNKGNIHPILLPVAPLAEQHRIVSKVDELMGLCDRLEAVQGERRGVRVRLNRSSLDRLTSVSGVDRAGRSGLSAAWQRVCDHFEVLYDTPETLPDLRQTILQLAVQGKLVPQDPNDAPAEEKARKGEHPAEPHAGEETARLEPRPPNDGATIYPMVTMEELVGQKNMKNGLSVTQTTVPTEYRCLSLSALRDGVVDCSGGKPVPLTAERAEPYLIRRNDVFVVRGNGSKDFVGRAGIANPDDDPVGAIFPDLFIRLPLDTERIHLDYFLIAWNSPLTRVTIEELAQTTSGIWKVNQGHIASISIPLPPLSEQKRIVSKVTHLLSQVTRLESTLTRRESTRTQLLTAAIHALLNGEEKK